jgi:DNA (cytosine-5)-methyltransferase 1
MGYPDTFVIPVSDTRAYKQFGNSVVVPVFKAIAQSMLPYLALPQQQELAPEAMVIS